MKHSALFGGLLLATTLCTNSLADGPERMIKPQLSEAELAGSCDKESLQQHLHHYNVTRLQLSEVLRYFADDQPMQQKTREQLQAYARNLEEMQQKLPKADPSTDEFANFDFHLGLTLTAMTVFLHTAEEPLQVRFETDRDEPNSRLGVYLARLEESRTAYETELAATKSGKCTS